MEGSPASGGTLPDSHFTSHMEQEAIICEEEETAKDTVSSREVL